jgi:prepilin-type N-terminal cleavage/methylation domain-containing protein
VEKGGVQGKLNGEKEKMRTGWIFKETGVTLIELLVTLIICSIVVAGIYRVFIAQSKAYTVQDQIVEIQQSVRGAMDILLKDLRMTGYYDDSPNSTVSITNPIAYAVQDSSITVSYAYFDSGTAQYQRHTVQYWRDAPTSRLYRLLTVNEAAAAGNPEILLENVDTFNLTYGVDADGDGAMDDRNVNGHIDDGDWVSAANVGALNVVAVRVILTGRPEKVDANDDRFKNVTPRSLVTAVTLRNLSFRK